MDVAEFDFSLPDSLIAQYPPPSRTACRLLELDGSSGAVRDRGFAELVELLAPGDLMVLNDTRVMAARLIAAKETGGRAEILVERILDAGRARARIRAGRPLRPGSNLLLGDGIRARVTRRDGEFYELEFPPEHPVGKVLERRGHVPLPPYIRRDDEGLDRERYQTVYGTRLGAVAAPTAGLHFDDALLDRLRAGGVEAAFITLHVGSGTFQPVRTGRVEAHRMHSEWVHVSAEVCQRVVETRRIGGRVVAIGTTCARALETAAGNGRLEPFRGETEIFVYPGFRFRAVDAMVTNFHLPRSTLLMLVCAFAGTGRVLAAYRHAVREAYRFFSYGDAMFVTRGTPPA